MKTSKAIAVAAKTFERTMIKDADIRSIILQEACRKANAKEPEREYEYIVFKIEYAVKGDYTESDKKPYYIEVAEEDGMIIPTLIDYK